jgi:hypothetical protein
MKPISDISMWEWAGLAVVVLAFIAWRVYKARKK